MLRLKNSLQQLSPQAVLARGYAIVLKSNGEIVKNSQQVMTGESIKITLLTGIIKADVTDIEQ